MNGQIDPHRAIGWLALAAVVATGLPSCGNGTSTNMSGSSGAPGSAGAGAGAAAGSVPAAGAASGGCFGREVCPGGQVRDVVDCECRDCRGPDDCGEGVTCDPVTSRCEQDVPCSSHTDCGRVSACSAAGVCEENAPGGPCARENNCPLSEHCTLGFCGCDVIRYRVPSTIAGETLPCSFDLADSPKPSDSDVLLYFGQEPVTRDPTHQDGWDYDIDTNRVEIFGDSCARLSSRSVVEASLVYTCSITPH